MATLGPDSVLVRFSISTSTFDTHAFTNCGRGFTLEKCWLLRVLNDLDDRRILPKEHDAPRGADLRKVTKMFTLDRCGLLRTLGHSLGLVLGTPHASWQGLRTVGP